MAGPIGGMWYYALIERKIRKHERVNIKMVQFIFINAVLTLCECDWCEKRVFCSNYISVEILRHHYFCLPPSNIHLQRATACLWARWHLSRFCFSTICSIEPWAQSRWVGFGWHACGPCMRLAYRWEYARVKSCYFCFVFVFCFCFAWYCAFSGYVIVLPFSRVYLVGISVFCLFFCFSCYNCCG